MKKEIFAMLALALLCAGPAMAQQTQEEAQGQAQGDDAAAKRQDVRRLLELTGAAQIGQQVLGQMMETIKRAHPKVPESFWDDLAKEFDSSTMIELIVPIYDKHLTHEDVKGLIAFYESPVGRKLASVQPAIAQESVQAGQQWGMEIARRMQQRLAARQKEQKGK